MKSKEANPPRWAEAILRSLVRPSDRESISGDLLEEYREARHPALGGFGANAWYVKHVLSVLLRLIWPWMLAVSSLTVLSLAFPGPWNFSLVPAPAVSLLHCVIYLWAGCHGAHRTRLVRTGTLAAAATSFFAFTVTFAFLAVRTPGLVIVTFSKPFIFVILSLLLLQALCYGVVAGTVGGVIGRWFRPTALGKEVRTS